MDMLSVLGLALAPVVFIFTLIYALDKYDKEPIQRLVVSFVLGILIAVPAVALELSLADFLGVGPEQGVINMFIYAMVVIAGSEEFLKYFVLRFYAFPHKAFDEPYDGIMYAVAVSLGFAAIENVLYVSQMGFEVAILRMFTAVPGHAMMAIIMGYFMGLAKFKEDETQQTWLFLLALGSAVLIHGLYDFFLMYDDQLLAPLALVVLVVALVLSIRAIRIHQRISPHR